MRPRNSFFGCKINFEHSGRDLTFIRIDRINMLKNTKSKAKIDLSNVNILACVLHLRNENI